MSNYSLYDFRLNLESVLNDIIGKFSDESKGIWVEPPTPPTGTPTGLICYISANPEQYSTQSSTGGLKAISECFVVTLVQYDRSKTTTKAMRLIQKNFSIFAVNTIPATETTFEQCVIRVRNYGFI